MCACACMTFRGNDIIFMGKNAKIQEQLQSLSLSLSLCGVCVCVCLGGVIFQPPPQICSR